MAISIVLFIILLSLSCLSVGIGVYFYCLFSYNTKPFYCESIQEENLKIPIEINDGVIELDTKILKTKDTSIPAPCVILCHGWTSNLNGLRFLQPLVLQGYILIAYSSRGHGKSGGNRDFPEIYQDIIKVIDFFQQNENYGIDINRIAVIGFSMGGSIALNFAYLDERVKVVVGMSTVHNVKESYDQKKSIFSHPFWARSWLRLTGLSLKLTEEENRVASPKYYLSQSSNTKVFLIHSKDDPFVEFDNFEKNVALLGLPSNHTLVFEKGGHNLFHKECLIISQIIKWLKDYL
ncbi:MAG: alpha/beta hydrolase family protein [Promethearchaeota archaeon]